MITILCLLLLTFIPCTHAVILDTQSLQILHTLPHAIIYVYDESPDESITPLLEETDIACFVVSRDVEPLKENAYISTRGVMTPFHSEITNMSIAYIIDRRIRLLLMHAQRMHGAATGRPDWTSGQCALPSAGKVPPAA